MELQYPFTVATFDVGGTKMAGGLVTYEAAGRAPRVSERCSRPTEAARGGAAVLDELVEMARGLVGRAGQTEGLGPVVGVGVSAAGTIRQSDGLVADANEIMPGWKGQPVGERLSAELGLDCAVLNDVHAHALGELRHGSAAGAQTCLVVAVGTGIGGAVITDGHILGGAHGFAGMVGHIVHPAAAGITCACGAMGHLESVASGSGIEACYRRGGGQALTGPQISERAEAGEPLAMAVIRTAGLSLGESIASLANVLDPDCVVLSGSVCAAGPLWRAAVEEGLAAQLQKPLRNLPILPAKLGSAAPLVGAAEQLLERISRHA